MKELQDRICHGNAPDPTSTGARISVRITSKLSGKGKLAWLLRMQTA
jgi:hypothetical protein